MTQNIELQFASDSATWPDGVRRLANRYMNNPMQIYVGSLDLAAVHSVEQHIVFLEESDKKEWLFGFLDDMAPTDKALVFVGRKLTADDISSDLAIRVLLPLMSQ